MTSGAVETPLLNGGPDRLRLLQLQEAVSCMPSLLVLDNLHMLCPAENPAPEQAAANSGAASLVQWLCDVLDYFSQQPQGRPPLPGDSASTMQVCLSMPSMASI